jgi:hypothetical protein
MPVDTISAGRAGMNEPVVIFDEEAKVQATLRGDAHEIS